MDDFGNIVYVVAAIGWFVWNTYRKAQQNKEKPAKSAGRPINAEPYQEKKATKSLEDLIMEQIEGRKKPEPAPVPVQVPIKRDRTNKDKFLSTDLTHSHLSENYIMSQGEAQGHRVTRQVRKMDVVEVADDNLMEKLLPNGFDLRQAVVLNTILERPYK